MSGMINAAAPANGTALPTAPPVMSDPVLEAAEKRLESQLAPDNRQNYQKIVVAGLAAALSRGPNGVMASLRKSPDPVRDAARGAVALVMILRRDARGVMPLKAMVPAAMTLMLHALDFVNRSGMTKVGSPELVRATHIFTNEIFAKFHITQPLLQNLAQRVHSTLQNPTAMEMVHRKLGSVKAPGASEPTVITPPT